MSYVKKAAGLSFMIAHPVTHVATEIAHFFSGFSGDASSEELTAITFNPGQTLPTTEVIYGAVTRTFNLTGFWSPEAELLFNACSGVQGLAYEQSPMGRAVGNIRIVGACNFGAWSGPQGDANGLWNMQINMSLTSRYVETIITPPATVAITSSGTGEPTLITSAAHGLTTGQVVTIAGHTGATPDINGLWPVTVLSSTTFTIPASVTVGGTGGTIQN